MHRFLAASPLASQGMFSSDEDELPDPRPAKARRVDNINAALEHSGSGRTQTSETDIHSGNVASSSSDIGATGPDVARHWPETLNTLLLANLGPRGTQRRPIRLQTGFSGTASIVKMLRCMGVDVVEDCAVEKKDHAWEFCQRNGLLPGCWFKDMSQISERGQGKCRIHDQDCKLPANKPDLYVAGFPCPPYSRQRHGSNIGENRRSHPDFAKAGWTIKHMARVRPRMAVLENVPDFDMLAQGDSVSACTEFCDDLKKIQYESAVVCLDLAAWTQASSERIFILCVDAAEESVVVPRGLPLASIPSRAKEVAERMQKQVESMPTTPIQAFCATPGSEEWFEHVSMLETTADVDEPSLEESERSWMRQATAIRARWAKRGLWHCDTNPWTDPPSGPRPSLRGLPTPVTPRKIEVLNLAFLWGAYHKGLSPVDETARATIAEGLIIDLSQNPSRHRWGYSFKRVCRRSRPYMYSIDRMITPYEGFRIYGWPPPDLSSITSSFAWDLLGDSVALPPFALAVMPLLYLVEQN